MNYGKIPCVCIRGGTSKGLFFHEKDLPGDARERDILILSAFGSPDKRQIDGLGGADPLTSKVAIIRPSENERADIDYTFGQVGIDDFSINYSLNCGNMASGAAIFAVDEGLVRIEHPVTTVKIFNTNTKTLIEAKVETTNGKAAVDGDFRIDGVPGSGSMIELTFLNTQGAVTGEILPSMNVADVILLSNGSRVNVSIVDAGNLYTIVSAEDIGLKGNESPKEIEGNRKIIMLTDEILSKCSKIINNNGKLQNRQEIRIHKLAIVGGIKGQDMKACSENVDFVSRIISSNKKVHKAYAVTGAICVGAAAHMEGSVVRKATGKKPGEIIKIGHPEGFVDIEICPITREGEIREINAKIRRTARRLMEGYVYVRKKNGI